MRCLSPIRIRQKVADAFGNKRETFVDVPCGKCLACLSRRKQEWMFRLKQEWSKSFNTVFVTLTYSDEEIPCSPHGDYTVSKKDFQLFMKRLRKQHDTPLRFFGIGEYGSTTYRPHYHLLLFNCEKNIADLVRFCWQKGHTKTDECSGARINYICKYVVMGGVDDAFFKRLDDTLCERPFMLCSRKPYIGYGFLTSEMTDYMLSRDTTVVPVDGYATNVPRIYRKKVFGDSSSDASDKIKAQMRKLDSLQYEKDVAHGGEAYHYKMDKERKEDYNRKVAKSFKLNRKL